MTHRQRGYTLLEVIVAFALLAMASPYPMFVLVSSGQGPLIVLGIALAAACMASFYAVIAGYVSGMFDTRVRYTAISLAYQICGAIEEPDARDIDVHALHQGFLRGMVRQGAVLHNNAEVVSAAHAGDAWTLTLADGRSLRARALVNAAGAWADHTAALCGASPVGLQPCRRTAFTFSGPQDMDFSHWPAVVGVDESFYFKPDAGQLLGSPANADPVPAHDVVPEELDVATGIYRIETATSLTIRRPKHTWAGLRSFVRDGDFVVGWDADAPAFFWLAAQGGYGIQSAAGASRLAADLLLGLPLCPGLVSQGVVPERLSPARFQQP